MDAKSESITETVEFNKATSHLFGLAMGFLLCAYCGGFGVIRRRGAPRVKPTHLIDSRGRWSRCGLADVQHPHSSGPFTDDLDLVTCKSCRRFLGLDPSRSTP